jgi:hypothetical protein
MIINVYRYVNSLVYRIVIFFKHSFLHMLNVCSCTLYEWGSASGWTICCYTIRLLCFGMCIICDLMVAVRFITSLRNASVVIHLLQLNLISSVLKGSVIISKVII